MNQGQLLEQAHTVLRETFGYGTFRLLQEEVISSVFAGEDSLVLMPTGGGKSLCYQVPPLVLPGLTLVVSLLIALMQTKLNHCANPA